MSVDNLTASLIESVRDYPVLYDTAHADHKNMRIRNQIWENIVEIIGGSDGDKLKSRWKNLRDSYSKHLRSNTGQTAKFLERYKTWPWAEQMAFMRPHLEFGPTHSNIQTSYLAQPSTSRRETDTSMIELLIESVRDYPVLYDTAHADHKNIQLRNKVWDNIAEIIGGSDVTGVKLKNKWKNLRDCYGKYLRSNETYTGQAAKCLERYKYWPWAEQMAFMRPYLEFGPTHTNIQTSDLAHPSTSQRETDKSMTEVHSPPSHQHSRRRQNSVQKETQVDKVIEFLNNNKRQTDFDDIDLVFLGYAKTVKKMSMSRQAHVKYQMAKIMMESELEHAEEASLSTVSRTLAAGSLSSTSEDTNDSSRDYEYIVSSPPPEPNF